jgi:hypothetical protein
MKRQLQTYIKLGGCVVVGALLIGCGDLEVGGGEKEADGGTNGPADLDGGGADGDSFGGPIEDLGGRKVIKPAAGYLQGQNAVVYELGSSSFVKGNKPNPSEALAGRTAGAAPVHPMYFFFNDAGDPLFAKPEKNPATGQFFMKGGKDLRTSNAFKLIDAKNEGREPDLLMDGARGSADYQRPLVDVLPNGVDARGELYSGIWEVVKVKVPRTFQADSVHDAAELLTVAAKPGSGIQLERSGFAINCPIVDARAYVVPSVSAYSADDLRIPQPQVELWYRKKRVDCFLANGWETLGTTIQGKTADEDVYRLHRTNENDERIQTFDIDVVPGTAGQTGSLVAPVGLMFVPHAVLYDVDKYFSDFRILAGPAPRRHKSDPPGYRPVRWLWNLEISATNGGDLVSAMSLKEAKLLDPRYIAANRFAPRKEILAVNVGLVSKEVSCLNATLAMDPCARLGLACSSLQDGPRNFCEEKKVRYNALCGPSIAKCSEFIHLVTDTAGQRQPDTVEDWFFNGARPSDDAKRAAFESKVPRDVIDYREALRLRGRRIVERGSSSLYECASDDTGVGRCLLSCDNEMLNENAGKSIETAVDVQGEKRTVTLPLDSRCGGKLMPGFSCSMPGPNEWSGVCRRECPTGQDPVATCKVPAKMWLWDDQTEFDLAQGTSCGSSGALQGCLLPTPTQTLSQ